MSHTPTPSRSGGRPDVRGDEPRVETPAAEGARLRTLQALWERYVTRGEFDDRVRPEVREAWERCAALGVDPRNLRRQGPDPDRLRRAREQAGPLLEAVEPFLQAAHARLGTRPHVMALLAPDATVVRLLSDESEDRSHVNLFEGASWAEADIGCNGGGTVLATGRPVILLGPEHFVDGYLGWTCAGAPIRGRQGEVVGALDLSVPGISEHPGARAWLDEVAGRVSAALAEGRTCGPEEGRAAATLLGDPFAEVRAALDRASTRSSPGRPEPPELAELRAALDEAELRHRQVARSLGDFHRELEATNERLLLATEEAHAKALDAEEARTRAERRAGEMTALLESMSEGVAVVDPEGSVILQNQSATRLAGGHDLNRLGGSLRAFSLDGRPLPREEAPPARLLAEGRLDEMEFAFEAPEGRIRRVVCSGSTVTDSDDTVVMGILVFRDVTRQREMEELRARLLHTAAHDMRTPLTAISLSAQSLGRRLEGAQRGAATRIQRNADRLSGLVADLVRTAEGQPEALEPQVEDLRLADLVREVVGQLAPQGKRERVRVAAPEGGPVVACDRSMLERVLLNLVDNALKYSPPDRPVRVEVSEGDGWARLTVVDQGGGIEASDLSRIFDPYFRSAATASDVEGRGLGLYSARLLVERHGGEISVRSKPARGSTFDVRLPLAGASG